jgi:hypothetical protein
MVGRRCCYNVTGLAYNVLSVVYNGQPVNDLSGGFFVNVQQVSGGDVTVSGGAASLMAA